MLLQTSDVKIKKVSEKNNVGVFEFAPLPAGFGRTLGSCLRRILLTSLRGGAVTEVRIPKVTHQFTSIPGVKEDVVEICQNLKAIGAQVHSNGPVIGRIDKKGKGPVTAGDIVISSEVEIVDKNAYICELADAKSTFEAEITFEPGVGYSPVEDRKSSKVGVILVDALFSPVSAVSYDVELTRKGDVSGLDKLTVTVTTNGGVSPEDAITESATILRNFFSRFAKGADPEEVVETTGSEELGSTTGGDVYIEDLALPTRTINALKNSGIDTLAKLAKLSDEDMADIKNLGDKSVKEIQKLLKKEGYEA